jgi:hypothetical protein
MRFYIKEERWGDFEQNFEKYGFKKGYGGFYYKLTENKRVVFVYPYSKEISDEKIDYTTYSGFAYEGEFRHRTKTYIGDLIADGYVIAKRN